MIPKNYSSAILRSLFASILLIHCANSSAIDIFVKKNKSTEPSGLYSLKDDVEILTADNFKNEIYSNERAWFVEFYNSWCGFCQRFAPSWKALATDVKAWGDLVGIGAIDCSDEANHPLCRNFEIMSYPTLKYFHENYEEGPTNFGLPVEAGQDVDEHRKKLLDVLINEQTQGRGKHLPNLLPFSGKPVQTLHDDVEYLILIIQKPTDYIGPELAMDLHKIKNIKVKYTYDNNTDLVDELKQKDFPQLYVFGRKGDRKLVPISEHSRDGYTKAIKGFLKDRHIAVSAEGSKNLFAGKQAEAEVPDMATFLHKKEQDALKERVKKIGDVVFQMDLETTLRYSLKHEIVGFREITGERLDALKAYLDVLVKYFPFGKYGHMFLIELRDFVSNKKHVRGEDIKILVQDAEKDSRQVFSSPEQWLACKGSISKHRGYPCGVWKLFHYLTVNAAEASPPTSDPTMVLTAMYGYIKHFFGCSECSKHFQQMAKRRNLWGVSSWDESVLWLWMAHNEVNKRLAGDETEDPEFPKVQFPTKERCPRCHNSDDSWNLPEVQQYLRHMYAGINVRYIGSDTRILHLGLNGSPKADDVFRTVDTYMCFVLYVACFTFLVVLINLVWRRRRRYRKKAYVHDLLGKV
ncbi:unnamed protein product [Acanthoscelides obtectus]|uniref:Sulfhydryl oxidase n=1 Tax=Acanthoscelides obtectus TaxID=200917 RepID=A0A9P0L926_ACAOB|nr:unnamed protein product [Acanthoscelides obtectus]CAK1687348.1 Sulfhydryl oxidase 1 [Acanthoscelides obtectus]